MKTALDDMARRLDGIMRRLSREDDCEKVLESEFATLAELLSGLEKFAELATATLNVIDATRLNVKMSDTHHNQKIQDSLSTISTALMNYPDVFIKPDPETAKIFLAKISSDTLAEAWQMSDEQTKTKWRQITCG